MISERVRAALEADLKEVISQISTFGLMLTIGQGRVLSGDLRVMPAEPEDAQAVKVCQAKAPKAAAKARAVKPAGKAPLALPAPAKGSATLECCEVCGLGLSMNHGPKREFPLCAKHAGRWWQHRKNAGADAMAFGAWVEHQKNGGGRPKKA